LPPSAASPENLVMDKDPVADARALVEERFPQARWAVLAGSVITAHRTAGSDLDIVVLLPTDDPQAPHRDSRYFRGRPVELFVHDERTAAFGEEKAIETVAREVLDRVGGPLFDGFRAAGERPPT
jgi:hypothetical protein